MPSARSENDPDVSGAELGGDGRVVGSSEAAKLDCRHKRSGVLGGVNFGAVGAVLRKEARLLRRDLVKQKVPSR